MAAPTPAPAPDDTTATPQAKLAQYWIDQLDASEKWQRDWIARARAIVRRYKNELWRSTGASAQTLGSEGRRFAILWSNVQTLGPAIYAKTPAPVVSRRYKDADPVGKYASEVLERALVFSLEQYDFDDRMKECRDDYLVTGRGQLWARYVPHVGKLAQPESEEEAEPLQISPDSEEEGAAETITYQEALIDHVAYDDFGMQPCRSWSETDYVWRRVYMNRKQLVERFGDVGKKVPLDWTPNPDHDNSTRRPDDTSLAQKAAIYEIWDKPSGEVIWLSKGWPAEPLDKRSDPLGLTGFFPCPRPLMATTPPDEYIPVADYIYYQDQDEELNQLTQRIGNLVAALRMVGIYAGEENVLLANVFSGSQNTLIPVNNFQSLADKGGLKGVVEWLPIDMVVATLKSCFETRRQILDDIYQITGISDIIRGDSDPRETAMAQRMKGQWGSLRVRDRQQAIQRFARDAIRICGEIIASQFTADTLKAMTDVQLLTDQEKKLLQTQMQLAQEAQQQAQAQGLPPPPPPPIDPAKEQLLALPSWDDVMGLLRSESLRSFRVDIETDSTVEPDEDAMKQSFIQYVTALTNLITVAGQTVPAAPYTAPLFAEIAKESARVFRVSTGMEDVIDQVFDKAAQQPAAPPAGAGAGPTGPTPQELQLKGQEIALKAQQGQAANQVAAAKVAAEQQRTQTQAHVDAAQIALQAQQMHLDEQHRHRETALKVVSLTRPAQGELT